MFKLLLICALFVNYVFAAPTEIQENGENSVENAADTDNVVTTMINETPESSDIELTTKTPANVEISTVEPGVPTTKHRRVITFDQRQEGGSNVRVDLENFVIVIMSSPQKPSSPASSLLDLLSRSALKKAQSTKKVTDEDKLQPASPEVVVLDIGTPEHSQTQGRQTEEFIEGRTPYRVDISARENYNPTSRVSFTPTSNRVVFPSSSSGNYDGRVSKSLRDHPDEVDTNFALITNFGDGGNIANDNVVNEEQEFIDLPFDRLNYPHTDVDMMKLQLQGDNGDDWELKLIGANEECGPERRRNSYGICQFVQQL